MNEDETGLNKQPDLLKMEFRDSPSDPEADVRLYPEGVLELIRILREGGIEGFIEYLRQQPPMEISDADRLMMQQLVREARERFRLESFRERPGDN